MSLLNNAQGEYYSQGGIPPAPLPLHTSGMGKAKKFQRAPIYFKEWRKFRHLTQVQAGERAHLSQPTIARLEKGKQEFTQGNLEALAHAYNCEPADLFKPPQKTRNELAEFLMAMDESKRRRALKVLKAMDSEEEVA